MSISTISSFCTVHLRYSIHNTTTYCELLKSSCLWMECPLSYFLPRKLPFTLPEVCEDFWLSRTDSPLPLYYLTSTSVKEGNSWYCIYLTIWKNMSSILRTETIIIHFDLSLLTVLPICPCFFFFWYRLCLDHFTRFSSLCNYYLYILVSSFYRV